MISTGGGGGGGGGVGFASLAYRWRPGHVAITQMGSVLEVVPLAQIQAHQVWVRVALGPISGAVASGLLVLLVVQLLVAV